MKPNNDNWLKIIFISLSFYYLHSKFKQLFFRYLQYATEIISYYCTQTKKPSTHSVTIVTYNNDCCTFIFYFVLAEVESFKIYCESAKMADGLVVLVRYQIIN